jgi:hypothetical protein
MRKLNNIIFIKILLSAFCFLSVNAAVVSENTLNKIQVIELYGKYLFFLNGAFKGNLTINDLKTSLRTLKDSDFSLKGIIRSEASHYNIPTLLHQIYFIYLTKNIYFIETDLLHFIELSVPWVIFSIYRYHSISKHIKTLRPMSQNDMLFNILATFSMPLTDLHYEDNLFFEERLALLQENEEVKISEKLFEIYEKRLLRAVF